VPDQAATYRPARQWPRFTAGLTAAPTARSLAGQGGRVRGIFKLLAVAAALASPIAAGPADAQATSAPGPSFACARAATAVEHLICADPELRALDLAVARFYASGMRNSRPGRAVREQREWLAMRDNCDTRACLRQAMTERLWMLSEAVGRDLPAYADEDADAELVVADLGGGWYAFGAVGYWHGPTINSAAAAGAFRLQGDRGEIAGSEVDCAVTLTHLPGDRWDLVAHPPAEGGSCGGMNATVEGEYRRSRH
jgi:uncharacterized protein